MQRANAGSKLQRPQAGYPAKTESDLMRVVPLQVMCWSPRSPSPTLRKAQAGKPTTCPYIQPKEGAADSPTA